MTKTWKVIAGTALGVALVAGAGAAVAARGQGPHGPGGFGPGGFEGRRGPGGPGMGGPGGPGGLIAGLRELDLTDAQREQVRVAMESHKAGFEAQATSMMAARKALHEVVTAEAFDEDAIRQASAAVAALEADGAVLRARVHADVWALLTPEQQQKARDVKARMAQRFEQMRERFEQRRGQRQERRQQRRG